MEPDVIIWSVWALVASEPQPPPKRDKDGRVPQMFEFTGSPGSVDYVRTCHLTCYPMLGLRAGAGSNTSPVHMEGFERHRTTASYHVVLQGPSLRVHRIPKEAVPAGRSQKPVRNLLAAPTRMAPLP